MPSSSQLQSSNLLRHIQWLPPFLFLVIIFPGTIATFFSILLRKISLFFKKPPKDKPQKISLAAFRNAQIYAPIAVRESQSKFLRLGIGRTHSDRITPPKSAGSDSSITFILDFLCLSFCSFLGLRIGHLVVSLGIILAIDKYLKQAFVAAAIKLPSALLVCFCIFTILVLLDVAVPAAATALMNFLEPAFMFIKRWPPLFYVPIFGRFTSRCSRYSSSFWNQNLLYFRYISLMKYLDLAIKVVASPSLSKSCFFSFSFTSGLEKELVRPLPD